MQFRNGIMQFFRPIIQAKRSYGKRAGFSVEDERLSLPQMGRIMA